MNQLFKIQIYTFLALGLLALALLAIIFIVVFNKNQKETSQSNNENNTNIEIFDKVQLDYVITHYNPFIKCFEMFGKNGKSYLQNSSSNAFKPSSSNSFYKALSNISSQVHFDINQSSTTQSGYDCTTIQNFEIMTKNIINVFDNLIKTSPEFKNEVDLLRKAFKIESVDNIKNWISDINTLDNLIYKTQNFINKQGNSSLNPKILLGKFKGRAIRTIVFSTFDTTFVQEFKF